MERLRYRIKYGSVHFKIGLPIELCDDIMMVLIPLDHQASEIRHLNDSIQKIYKQSLILEKRWPACFGLNLKPYTLGIIHS